MQGHMDHVEPKQVELSDSLEHDILNSCIDKQLTAIVDKWQQKKGLSLCAMVAPMLIASKAVALTPDKHQRRV